MTPSCCLISRFSNDWRLMTNLGTEEDRPPQHVMEKQWNNGQAKYMSLYVNEQLVGVNCKLQKRLLSHGDKAPLPLPGCLQGTWKMVPKVQAPTGWVRWSTRPVSETQLIDRGPLFSPWLRNYSFVSEFWLSWFRDFFKLIYFCHFYSFILPSVRNCA